MPYRPIDTTEWVGQKLCEPSSRGAPPPASAYEVRGPHLLRVERENRWPFDAAIISEEHVRPAHFEHLLDRVEMVVNVPSQSKWSLEAIDLVRQTNRSFGGIKDLMSACNIDEVREYVRNEYRFFEERIATHDEFAGLERLTDRLYAVHRKTYGPKRIVLLNDYEVGGAAVFSARRIQGNFDIIHHTNPNGRVLEDGASASNTLRIAILNLGELFGRLNNP
ncbi:hypothetical protein [Ensifer adhaerens]